MASMLYGVCNSASDATVKQVTLDDFDTLTSSCQGVSVYVRFLSKNTADQPKLKVGSTDALTIYQYGSPVTSGAWDDGELVCFVFDGVDKWSMFQQHVDSFDNITYNDVIEAFNDD